MRVLGIMMLPTERAGMEAKTTHFDGLVYQPSPRRSIERVTL
jgi:hypothetical protein